GVTLDLEHMFVTGLEIRHLVNLFENRILNVHIRDSDGNLLNKEGHRNYLTPGSGLVNFQETIQVLRASGYEKALTVEHPIRRREDGVTTKELLEALL
ncbi:MAG: sugar phosphate isomerase/epimerase family protein, partial [Promethearchaeota archaeon]